MPKFIKGGDWTMSYGKYGMKKIYGQPDFSNMASIAYSDPTFALGMLLAKGYNKQYDDRGVRKAQEEMMGDLGAATAEDRNKALEDYLANGGGMDFDMAAANKALDEYKAGNVPAGSFGMSAGQAEAPNTLSAGGNTMSIDELYKGMPSGKVTSAADQEKISELANMYAQIKNPANNPDFSSDQWAADQRLKQRALGRPDYQIDEALAAVLPQAQDKEKLSKQAYADQLMGLLSGYNPKEGYDPKMMQYLSELGRYDSTAAALWAKNIPTGGDEYRNKNVIEGQERQFEYGQKAADNQLGRAKDLGQFNSDLKSAEIQRAMQQKIAQVQAAFPGASPDQVLRYVLGSGKSGVQTGPTTQQIGAAKFWSNDEYNWYKTHVDLNGNITEPYPHQEQADAARAILAGAMDNNGLPSSNGDQSQGFDKNNYYHGVSSTQYLLDMGYKPEDVRAAMMRKMGDGELYRKVMADMKLDEKDNQRERIASENKHKQPSQEELWDADRLRREQENTQGGFRNPYTGQWYNRNPYTGK